VILLKKNIFYKIHWRIVFSVFRAKIIKNLLKIYNKVLINMFLFIKINYEVRVEHKPGSV